MWSFHPKVTSSVLGGALAAIVLGELSRRGVTLAPEEASGITVVISFICGYFTPSPP